MATITNISRPVEKLWIPVTIGGGLLFFLAAIATPNLYRSRMAADESARAAGVGGIYENTRQGNSQLPGDTLMSVAQVTPRAAGPAASASPETKNSAATAGREIVRTSSLELSVKSPADAAEQIRLIAGEMGGYVETAQIGGTKEVPTADITIRVPAARFEDAKATIRKLGARIESEKTDARDVTRQYVDLEARLRNLRAEEAQYLGIMKSAYKVDDMLAVSQKLSEVRGEIEQQQAEFQTLSKQVETVAITISLRTIADAQVFGFNWRPLYQLKVAARDGIDALADYATAMAAILFYLPVVLAWGLTILLAGMVGWHSFRWAARRFFDRPQPTSTQSAISSI
jgi:Domain of unknown function (DUF4349)